MSHATEPTSRSREPCFARAEPCFDPPEPCIAPTEPRFHPAEPCVDTPKVNADTPKVSVYTPEVCPDAFQVHGASRQPAADASQLAPADSQPPRADQQLISQSGPRTSCDNHQRLHVHATLSHRDDLQRKRGRGSSLIPVPKEAQPGTFRLPQQDLSLWSALPRNRGVEQPGSSSGS